MGYLKVWVILAEAMGILIVGKQKYSNSRNESKIN